MHRLLPLLLLLVASAEAGDPSLLVSAEAAQTVRCCRGTAVVEVVGSYRSLVGALQGGRSSRAAAHCYRLEGLLKGPAGGGLGGAEGRVVRRLLADVGAVKNGPESRIRERLPQITDGVAWLVASREGGGLVLAEAWCPATGDAWLQAPGDLRSPYADRSCAAWR